MLSILFWFLTPPPVDTKFADGARELVVVAVAACPRDHVLPGRVVDPSGRTVCWLHRAEFAGPFLCVCADATGKLWVYDPRGVWARSHAGRKK